MTSTPLPAQPPQPLRGGALTRSRILDAAAALMREVGLTRATTKEIARRAGCSEATLYKYFRDKEEIFMGVLHERVPAFPDHLTALLERAADAERPVGEQWPVGEQLSVREELEEVARRALVFYREMFPMGASLFASQDLLAAHRSKMDVGNAGPHQPTRQLAAYLGAEQRLGRLPTDLDAAAASALLVGACFHRAFLSLFYAPDPPQGTLVPRDDEEFVRQTVRTLLNGAGGAGAADRPAERP
jgi:AcrR family transcriptional regulator